MDNFPSTSFIFRYFEHNEFYLAILLKCQKNVVNFIFVKRIDKILFEYYLFNSYIIIPEAILTLRLSTSFFIGKQIFMSVRFKIFSLIP